MHVKKRFIYWKMSRCAWEELCKHLFCCHFLQCNSHFNLKLNKWCSKKISPAGLHFEAALKAPYSDTGVPSQGFQINFGYRINIKREEHGESVDPNGNTFRSDCQTKYPISNGVFALPSTHSLCLVTACQTLSLPNSLAGHTGLFQPLPISSCLTSCLSAFQPHRKCLQVP